MDLPPPTSESSSDSPAKDMTKMSRARSLYCPINLLIISLSILLTLAGRAPAADIAKLPEASTQAVDFGRDIQPLFQKACYSCHGPEKQEGGLRLDLKERALQGGDTGKAVLPGKSHESKLI